MKPPIILAITALLTCGPLRAETAQSIDPNALSMLKRMSVTLTEAKAFSFRSGSLLEVPAKTGQLITLHSVGTVSLRRPDRIRGVFGGDAPPFDFFYDGNAVTVTAPLNKVYSTLKAPSSIDTMFAGLHEETGIRIPSSPLLMSDPYAILTRRLLSAVVVGPTRVNGVECDHLAFRSPGVNWEIWIEAGSRALPRRLAVTFTDKPGFPRTIIDFSHWNLHPWIFSSRFEFRAPKGFRETPFLAVLRDADR